MTRPELIDVSAAARRIAAAQRIVVTSHARADGDALGCVLAMGRLLRGQGKNVAAFLHEAVAARYEKIAEFERAQVWEPSAAGAALAGADLLLLLDTCAAVQLGDVAQAVRNAGAHVMAIDHHVTRDDVAAEAWVDEAAAACAQLVLALADHARWPIDAGTATLLFTGLATDTGWFRFSNADARAFADAARLISAGARPNEVYEAVYLNEVLPRLRLMGEVLRTFESLCDSRLAIIRVTRDMLARCGATNEMTEDIINEPQRLGGGVAAVMLVEPEPGSPVRVSFRSKRDIDVAKLAARWGGGGHSRAAGAKIMGEYAAVCGEVVEEMRRAVGA